MLLTVAPFGLPLIVDPVGFGMIDHGDRATRSGNFHHDARHSAGRHQPNRENKNHRRRCQGADHPSVYSPLTAAGSAARDIADAGHSLDTTASWLAVLLALAVAAPPILAVAMPWLFLRLRFFLRKQTMVGLARTPAGVQLLALRALANRPLRRLATVSPDPVGAWRREDPIAIRGLAALELRAAGVTPGAMK